MMIDDDNDDNDDGGGGGNMMTPTMTMKTMTLITIAFTAFIKCILYTRPCTKCFIMT